MAVTEQQVAELYVATFNRAPDAAGLAYWVNDSGLTIEQIAQSFFDQPETQALYPEGTTDEAFVTSIYQNLFNREPDAEGLAYWTGESGLGGTMTRDVMIEAMKNGAEGDDATIIANKATVGLYYVEQGLEGTDYSLASVTADTATVDTAKADIDTYVPQTIALEAGADAVTGGSGDDTISGVASALSSSRTFDATDAIDGGDGTDTLSVDLQTSFTGFTTGSLANVETINLTNEGAVARTFTGTGITGTEQYNLTGAVNLAGMTEIDTVVAGARTADLSIAYASKVTDGTADSLSLMVTDNGTADDAATTANEEDDVAITVSGIETVDLTVEGTNVLDLTNVAAKALTATGAGSLKATALATATKTVDASGVTGDVNLTLTNVSSATSVATGSGDDTVTVDVNDDLAANATLAGGEGDDTLVVTAANGDTVQYDQSGFETIALGAQNGGTLTMSLKNTTDVTTIVALGSAATAGDLDQDVTLAGAGAADLTFNIQGANATTPTITSDHSGASTIVVDTPATTATTTAPTGNDVALTLTGSSSVDLTVASLMSYTGVVTASKATSVEVALEGRAWTGSKIDAAAATSVAITSVNTASDLILDAAAATDLSITNAKDLDLQTSTLTALESLTSSGAGDLNLTGVALGALNSATITNTGDVDLNNTGSGTLDYGTTVTSTGAATFDIGTMTTNNQAITLTVADAVGAVTASTIAAGTGAVNVTVSTASTLGLAAITGGNVTVDLSGVLGAVTYGGDITVSKNFTFTGSELQGNDLQTQDIILDGTTNTLSLTGGIGNDVFDVIGDTTTTALTITGDLDIGTNDITVDMNTNAAASAYTVTMSGLSNYDTAAISLSDSAAATVALGGGANADTLQWNGAQKATVTGFDTTEDKLSFDNAIAGLTATTGTAQAAGSVVAGALTDGSVYVISDGATALTAAGTEAIADYTDLTDVAAYLAEGYTSTVNADAAVFVINDLAGDKTYVYSLLEATDLAVAAGDLTLIGVITEESGAAIVAGDIA